MHPLNHIAILTKSIEASVAAFGLGDSYLSEIESFESEGTRELYIGRPEQSGRLLFMEAVGDGPYQRALRARGPGLHHIAIDVEDIKKYIRSLSGSGWYLHPFSIETLDSLNQAWLARPGERLLVEINQTANKLSSAYTSKIEIPLSGSKPKLLENLRCSALANTVLDEINLYTDGKKIRLEPQHAGQNIGD